MARLSGAELAELAMDARVERVLSTRVRSSAGFVTRRALIHSYIDAGATVETARNGERRLVRPDGVFLTDSGITKLAMDYAVGLVG